MPATEIAQTVRLSKNDIKRRKLKRALEHVFSIVNDASKPDYIARAEARSYLFDLLGRTTPGSRRDRQTARKSAVRLQHGSTVCDVQRGVFDEMIKALKAHGIIHAIRILRGATALGLKEAKDIIDYDVTIARQLRAEGHR